MTTFNKAELAAKFGLVKNVIAKTSTLNHLKMLNIRVNKNKFKLTGSNGEIQVTATGECVGNESFNVCVLPATFSVMLGSAKSDVIIRVEDMIMSTLSSKSKFNISAIDGDLYPLLKMDGNVNKFNLMELIGSVYKGSSKNQSTPNLCGTLIDIKDGIINAVATDSRIMFVNKDSIDADDSQVIIPNSSAEYLASNDTDGFLVSGNALKATSEQNNIEIICKIVDAKYPDWRRIVSVYEKSFTVDRDELVDSVSTINKIDSIVSVNLKSSDDVLTVSARDKSGQSFMSEIEFDGDEIDMAASPENLLKCLQSVDCDKITIGFDSKKGIQSINGNHMFFLSGYKQ